MKILRATHLGMCFGVRDAIALALSQSKSQPVTILGDLVHNETVLKTLRQQGVKIEHQVADVTTPTIMITAHGTSERTLNRVREYGLNVLEATCPLVHHAHQADARLVKEGFHPVIIGKREHVEVRGRRTWRRSMWCLTKTMWPIWRNSHFRSRRRPRNPSTAWSNSSR